MVILRLQSAWRDNNELKKKKAPDPDVVVPLRGRGRRIATSPRLEVVAQGGPLSKTKRNKTKQKKHLTTDVSHLFISSFTYCVWCMPVCTCGGQKPTLKDLSQLFSNLCFFCFVFNYDVLLWGHACEGTHVEVRGQFCGVSSLLPPLQGPRDGTHRARTTGAFPC